MTLLPERLPTAPELVNGDPRVITVWSDIGCPWATLALHRLRRAAAERGQQLLVDHRAFPLELFNRMPTPKGIVDAEVVIIAGRFPELGWQLWAAPEHTYPATTLPALEAVQAAKAPEVGGLVASDHLDAALRHAFYAEHRCIAVHSEILEIAATCPAVDAEALATALAAGAGRRVVYRDWQLAAGPSVQGSPHLFSASGYAEHNPGAVYRWTARPPIGFPVLDSYDPDWPARLLDGLPAA
jgi:predicted DsbA family dithiol-disulfide isomerase